MIQGLLDMMTSSMKIDTMIPPTSKPKSKKRDPPPILFLHPSPDASHASLPGIFAPSAPVPGPNNKKWDHSNFDANATSRSGSTVPPEQQRLGRTLQCMSSSRDSDRMDALWAEMQATLEEVELAASEGTHVFGHDHGRKLADLRAAQIFLAQAWARSEADDTIEMTLHECTHPTSGDVFPNMHDPLSDTLGSGGGEKIDASKNKIGTANGRPWASSGGADRLGAKLEVETEVDILLARKRQEANDEYFQRVNRGVIDVVAKLEEVALAMRAVEEETKDLWSETIGIPSSAKALSVQR